MALTKPRAYQIYDIDYKQAVRVVSLSNVTLSGGAPNSVDGVNLSLNDRILVAGQTSGAQNGIYYVTTVGTGANGTWARSTDTDATGELLSGTIVMVTEGTTYADTQWKLTTNDPITIGSTALTFVQNYLANSISYGNTAFAIESTNANATISVAGTSNVAVFATTGEYVTGLISATGNVIGGNITTAGQVSATANITGGNILTSGIVSATGNVQGGNLVLVNGNLTLGNVNAFTSNSAIQGWSYPTISLSISASEGTSTGLFFGNSGSSFYVVGTTNDRVYQYNMSTVNMANTGTVFGNVSVATQDSTPADLFINSSGANMYMLGSTNRVVYQYTLSTPWNITTASYATLSANISAQEATPTGVWFKPDLTTMYLVGTTNSTVYQYTLATPGNIATATYASKSVSVSTATTPHAVNLSSDGAKMWVLSQSVPAVYEWNLATPWDVSTATHSLGNSFGILPQEGTPTGMYVDLANTRAWVVGSSSDTVFQYNTANSIIAQANAVGIQGQLAVQGNAWFGQQVQLGGAVRVETTLTVDSTFSAGSTSTFSTTTGTIGIGTSQTTGTTTIGGTAQTGNLLIGRSTATQGIVIGNGVTASGSTKTIDIGTLGAANSITNINIGPTAGNATVSFLSNALVSIANTSGAALSVVGNITGGNINTAGAISVTGNITSAANIAGGNLIATANVVTVGVSASGNVTGGNLLTGGLISSTGNVTSAGNVSGTYLLGNVFYATGISANKIYNGTTEVAIGTASGNANITVGGTSNVVVFATTGQYVTGLISASGNITSAANVSGGNLLTGGLVSATGNVTSAGNVSGTYLLGNVFYATGISASKIYNGTSEANIGTSGGNANITIGGISNVVVFATTGEYVTGLISASGNVTSAANITGGNVLATTIVSGASLLGSLVSVSGNITGGNINTAGLISAAGNVTGANIVTGGSVSSIGNIYAGTANAGYVFGNATYMTGISAAISVTKIENGNSNVWVNSPGGDVTVTAGGVSNVAVFSTGSMTLQGAFGTPKTISANVVVAESINAMLIGPLVFGNGYGLTVPTSSTVYIYSPNG